MTDLGGRPLEWRPALICLGLLLVLATAVNMLAFLAGFDEPEWLPTLIIGAIAGAFVTPVYRIVYDRTEGGGPR